MGGPRQSHLTEMFSHPRLAAHFDPPAFSPGVPVRSIRNCRNLLTKAHEAGLLPEAEWEALATTGTKLWGTNPIRYLDALTDPTQPGSSQKVCPHPHVPIAPGRHGSQRDRKLHYSVELWWKSKSISRERGVLACFLAHLIAMRTLVEGGYDLILEDNVRAPIFGASGGGEKESKEEVEAEVDAYCECAERIWATMEASERLSNASKEQDEANTEEEGISSKECHLRYYGWLGSKPNLKWLYETHMPRMRARTDFDDGGVLFPYPTLEEFRTDKPVPKRSSSTLANEEKKSEGDANETATGDDDYNQEEKEEEEKGSGTPIWGAYAYWVSRPAYEALLSDLRHDVGGILWRGRGMPAYIVKPIDRVLPRRTMGRFGRDSVHITTVPAFFRAPMLKSTIHSQLDVEFCKSSEYQMEVGGACDACSDGGTGGESDENDAGRRKWTAKQLGWDSLWLTDEETRVIAQRVETGDWSFVETQKMDNRRKPRHIKHIEIDNGTFGLVVLLYYYIILRP